MAAGLPLNVYNAKVDGTAMGNGTVDDRPAIQALIDKLDENGNPLSGFSIYLPAGTYRLDSALEVRNKSVNIFGDGIVLGPGGTWLKRSTDAPAINYVNTATSTAPIYGNTLRNLAIDGKTTYTTDAVSASYQSCMRIDNVLISKSGGNGLYLRSVWDSVFHQVFLWHCGKASAGQAALFIEGIDAMTGNNDHRYEGCHFEHCQDGPLVIAAPPTVMGAMGHTNSIVFDNCKFESSGRPPGDESPIQLNALTNSSFIGCRFSQYGRALDSTDPTDRACAMTLNQCAGIEVVAGICVNKDATPPTAFAAVNASSLCRFSIRGYRCGDLDISGDVRGVVREVWDYGTPLRTSGRALLDFPPLNSIDAQAIAGAKHGTVADPEAPRGRALLLSTPGSQTDGLSLQIGGAGVLGITVSALVRADSGGTAFRFEVMKNGATLVLRRFTAAANYRREYCIVPRTYAMADAVLVLRGVAAGSVLRVVDVVWEQGMFQDWAPDVTAPDGDLSLRSGITFEKGEALAKRSFFVAGSVEGWGVIAEGTTASPASAGFTGTMAAGSNQLGKTSGNFGLITVGSYLTASNLVTRAQVLTIAGNTLTLSIFTPTAVGPVAVSFTPPLFKKLGVVES